MLKPPVVVVSNWAKGARHIPVAAPCAPYYPDMNAATPLGAWGRSVIGGGGVLQGCQSCCTCLGLFQQRSQSSDPSRGSDSVIEIEAHPDQHHEAGRCRLTKKRNKVRAYFNSASTAVRGYAYDQG